MLGNARLPLLERLSLSKIDDANVFDLFILLGQSKGKLRELDISRCSAIQSTDLIFLTQEGYLNNVVRLNLSSCQVTDEALALDRLTHLELDLTGVTGVGIKAMVLKPGDKLKYLNLDHCPQVAPDAAELARRHGIKLSFAFPEQGKGGRRVRYG